MFFKPDSSSLTRSLGFAAGKQSSAAPATTAKGSFVFRLTFFGRASRKSLFWRMLKGRGWEWNTHSFIVSLVWALATWRILVALVDYLFRSVAFFDGQSLTAVHQIGLLLVTLAGAALWTFSNSGNRRTKVNLHSTQLFSGVLFILMAVLMLSGTLEDFNSLIPPELAVWFINLEDKLIGLFA